MSKFINGDLLRKEIEFAKSVYSNSNRVVHGVADAYRQDGRAAMCDDILKKIDSIQQEQPEVDLEKEIVCFLSNSTKMNKGEWRGKYAISDIGFRAVARHFYKLGLNTRKV